MKDNRNVICNQLITDEDLVLPINLKDIDLEFCKSDECTLKLYSKKSFSLSTLIPILNDFGFNVISETSYSIDRWYITKLELDNDKKLLLNNQKNIKDILISTLEGEIESGRLFELSFKENFCKKGILLIRSFVAYIDELVEEFSQNELVTVLVKHPKISRKFLDLFLVRFEPHLKDRTQRVKIVQDSTLSLLKEINSIEEDRILKFFYELLGCVVRTNFFKDSQTIAHKIELTKLKNTLRGIQPNLEIFVYSSSLRGTHLRMSKISRGGIRWSKRKKGYRQEIKSLMATQEAKNALIVPNGAKGGFVILKDQVSQEEFRHFYEIYIRSLLELVDNKQLGELVYKSDIVSYDDEDSYFVVAADRGTSKMSDLANSIAKDMNYWLGDAFASGSSTGYHHKKLGITARGALKATSVHFLQKGIDIYNQTISIVGVGSMSGDVFGNAMIQSKHFKLLAAISHDEIFIDPNPDLKPAYDERKRLFYAKKSKWSDYDRDKISQGGGVFKRYELSIELSPQIKDMLNLKVDYISGEDLAREVLKMNVDLLYFGGIGTYVKSSSQSNLSIGDKENEYVRVDADDLRAFAICEGANLAITMQARIDYSLLNGKINLDSIDNAAGVNTSDHEVNYKIMLNLALERGKIDNDRRIKILEDGTEFVVKSVLEDNFLQSMAISNDANKSKNNLKPFIQTVRVLESNMDIFKRSIFLIPKDRNFNDIVDDDGSIVRPVIATLILYSKIFIRDLLLNSSLVEKKEFQSELFNYFPLQYIDEFHQEISDHPLKHEIIATRVANKIVNHNGVTILKGYHKDEKDKFIEKLEKLYYQIEERNDEII